MTDAPAPTFPPSGRRLVVYTLYDRRGAVEDYVLRALEGLRPHADRLIVVVNGAIDDTARRSVQQLCDEIRVRENTGIDVGAQRETLDQLGVDVLGYDELLLTNDTWYGPIGSFDALFARMDARPAHFWGMTAHAAASPHPLTGTGAVAYHLQSYWLAVRGEMLRSAEWPRYWSSLPTRLDYRTAVLSHESHFTAYFTDRGFISAAAFDLDAFASENPSLWEPRRLIEEGCPILKRRVFFHPPLELHEHSVDGAAVLRDLVDAGYPAAPIWADLAHNVQPKILHTNLALLDVLPDESDGTYEAARPLRIAVVAHIFYEEMTDDLLDLADMLPDGYDLVVTTPTAQKADAVRAAIAARRIPPLRWEVRVVASNDGRDQSAFLVGARDVLVGADYDLVVKLHSKRTPQDGLNIGRHFAAQQFDNLLHSRGYASNLVAMFQRRPELGIVFPPMIHVGYPTLGQAWWANKPGAARLADELGIRVPLDDSSPLAPYGSMYIARPDALRVLLSRSWDYPDFGGAQQYRDGGLAHVLERMPSYAAAEAGYVTRTVLTRDYLALSQTALDFDLDQLTALVPGTPAAHHRALTALGHFGDARVRDFARILVRVTWPGLGARLRAGLRALQSRLPRGARLRDPR